MFKKNKIEIIVEGMHCDHCANKVEQTLLEDDNIKKVKVDLAKKKVTIEYKEKEINLENIESKINEIGFIYKGIVK